MIKIWCNKNAIKLYKNLVVVVEVVVIIVVVALAVVSSSSSSIVIEKTMITIILSLIVLLLPCISILAVEGSSDSSSDAVRLDVVRECFDSR